METQSCTFSYADRELVIQVGDLLSAQSDVIVCSNQGDLASDRGIAAVVSEAAGIGIQVELQQLIREYGEFLSGMATFTSAGYLPFKGLIHAISPTMGSGDERRDIEQAVTNSLLLCEANNWATIAFPALGTGGREIPAGLSSQAMIRAILRFWDARMDSLVERVSIYVRDACFEAFISSVKAENAGPFASLAGLPVAGIAAPGSHNTAEGSIEDVEVGELELNDDDITGLDNDEFSDWFK